jgi:hypothetical protein
MSISSYKPLLSEQGESQPKNGIYSLDITSFQLPGDWGVKAAGTDIAFSAPLVGDYEPVRIKNKFEK